MELRFKKELESLLLIPEHFHKHEGSLYELLTTKNYDEAPISVIAQLFCASPELYKTLGALLLFLSDDNVSVPLKSNLSDEHNFYLNHFVSNANHSLVYASLWVNKLYKSGKLYSGYHLSANELNSVRCCKYKPLYTDKSKFPDFIFLNTDLAIKVESKTEKGEAKVKCDEELIQIITSSPMLLKSLLTITEYLTQPSFYESVQKSLSTEWLEKFDAIIRRANYAIAYVDNHDSRYESKFLEMIDAHIRFGILSLKESLKDTLYSAMYQDVLKGNYTINEIIAAIDDILASEKADILVRYPSDADLLQSKILNRFILFDDFLEHWL